MLLLKRERKILSLHLTYFPTLKYFFILISFIFCISCETKVEGKEASYLTIYEASETKETATYEETISFYIQLAKDFPEINIQTIGETDSGYPLHVVTFNPEGDFNFENLREDKIIVLINNGIHPGESDGIDATMLLYRDLAIGKLPLPSKTVLVTIPIYNIGGALKRNSTTRANQNGPLEYGFRGNAQNYDLNRDFIKMDTKNAETFTKIFHLVKPDIFIDNHVSNGADYQYILTHLFTQHNKLGGKLGKYLREDFMPKIESSLKEKNWDITPYINVFNRPPEMGFSQFMDYPRYSTGYTTLWNTLGLMVETHMLKTYEQRVKGTYQLMHSVISVAEADHDNIKSIRKEAMDDNRQLLEYHLNWELDTTRTSTLDFKGFEAELMISDVTDLPRIKYNHDKPFTKKTDYYDYYNPADTVKVPAAYVIRKGWHRIMERLRANNIQYFDIEEDTVLNVESYKILNYNTRKTPYEGHYFHFDTEVEKNTKNVQFNSGDLVVPTDQPGIRYILETLEPQAPDSFFNWNFFDTVLQRKEDFSPYVFEEIALEFLKKDSTLRSTFLMKKELDNEFSEDWYAQLDWIYERSENLEESYMSYPVYRIIKNSESSKILTRD